MYKKIIQADGLRVIVVPKKDTSAVTLLVLFGVGSRYENKKISGVSHFVEHLMFKGTQRRPDTAMISKELDGVGAEYNAFTGKDHTGYYIKTDARHLALSIDMLSDMLVNSKFAAEEIQREKGVIIEEINMYEDNPMMYVEDVLEQLMFGDQPLGWSIAGWRETVNALTRQQIVDYYQEHYHPRNAVVIISGKISAGALKDLKRKLILPRQAKEKFPPVVIQQSQPAFRLLNKEAEQLQVALGFGAYSYRQAERYAASLLAIILGGNMSSRLFLSVRERQGLCYFIRCSQNIYQDTGALVIQSGLDKSRIEQALALILDELAKVKEQGVSAEELKRAKEFVRGKSTLDLEDSAALAQFFGSQELLQGKILTPAEQLKKIEAVTVKQVQKAAQEIFQKRKLNLAMIGPYQDKAKLQAIVKKAKLS
jgi:predicted Zn-dependent peptidase